MLLAHRGNAGADVNEMGLGPIRRQHLRDLGKRVGQIKRADQMRVVKKLDGGFDIFRRRRLRLRARVLDARVRRRHQELIARLDVRQ